MARSLGGGDGSRPDAKGSVPLYYEKKDVWSKRQNKTVTVEQCNGSVNVPGVGHLKFRLAPNESPRPGKENVRYFLEVAFWKGDGRGRGGSGF